jgi:two-component system alkaline phosphatase synthesis response regulator PhoP
MNEKIVVVDDETCILHVLAMKLRNAGYEVFTAHDGEEAMKLCLAEEPDLLITDYQMPYDNGLKLCEQYRRHVGRAIPTILITAREFDLNPQEVAQVGIQEVLAKPFSPREVVRIVQRLLEESAEATDACVKTYTDLEDNV